MAKVVLSAKALEDLHAIYLFISVDSGVYAEKVVNNIYKRIKILETHIRVGKVVPELMNGSIREVLEGRYRIIYLIENEDKISVLRIYHSSRLLKNI